MTLKKTKANELKRLSDKYDFLNIPKLYTFTHKEWIKESSNILKKILKKFKNCKVAIRSSSIAEDQVNNSKAGAFKSYLNVELKKKKLKKYINKVFKSYGNYNFQKNQILIQEMVQKIALSGVVTNRDLETGAPYYVISYDDFSGKSDTITSGKVIHKTVNIIKGSDQKIIKSLRIRKIYNFIKKIEKIINYKYIDIELVLDKTNKIYLLQIRPISVSRKWGQNDDNEIISRVKKIRISLKKILDNKKQNSVILSNMSDWNPAEMINDTSYPLALSLYKYLITDEIWHTSRESIGYSNIKKKLLTDFYFHPYIYVNHSLSSLFPQKLSKKEKNLLLSRSLNLIKKNNFIHDKIEFEASLNIFDFKTENKFKKIYKNINIRNKKNFLKELKSITIKNISIKKNSSIVKSLSEIEKLKLKNRSLKKKGFRQFKIEDNLKLLPICKNYGTFNFSILARHGFIAETFLRSMEGNIFSSKEIKLFKSSIKTVSSEIADSIHKIENKNYKIKFLNSYGHIRQSAYDVKSPKYSELIKDLYIKQKRKKNSNKKFKLTIRQTKLIEKKLSKIGLFKISVGDLFVYLSTSIKAREYGKLIFTQTLSLFLDNLKKWGKKNNIKPEDLNFLNLKILQKKIKDIKKNIIKNKKDYYINKKIILPSIIFHPNDCFVVPYRRTLPNFITDYNISSDYIVINNSQKINKKIIQNKIVCIKSADPGMDWIFSQNIKGLITLFGGSNSHMAIRCNEHNLPAAIGVGEEIFNRLKNYKLNRINLNCHDKKINLI